MPPTTAPISLPKTYGHDAMQFLEAHGLVAITPLIHSSDYSMALADPFMYYLKRRLGLVPAFSESEQLTRGTWAHTMLQYEGNDTKINQILDNRVSELSTICKALSVGPDKKEKIILQEKLDFFSAKSFFEASKQAPISALHGTFDQYYSQPHWVLLASELVLKYTDPEFPDTPIIIQIDRLYYHKGQNALWIVDLKTTADSPKVRMVTCPIEFQTLTYIQVTNALLSHLIAQFDLPSNTRLGGMTHLIMQKPTIRFGQNDRILLGYYSEGKRSGMSGRATPVGNQWKVETWPNEAQVNSEEKMFDSLTAALEALHGVTGKEPTKRMGGEPSPEAYAARCVDWYLGRGEFQANDKERVADPPINLSHTTAMSVLDENTTFRYRRGLSLINHYATILPLPQDFPMNDETPRKYRKVSPYAPFYVTPPHRWPLVVQRDHFIVRHRDEVSPPGE